MVEPNVLPVSEVARQKNCTPQAIYHAIDRGDLNEVRIGSHRMVLRDDKLDDFTIQETGGRRHKSYLRERECSNG